MTVMRAHPSVVDLALSRFASLRLEHAAREKRRQWCEASRASIVRRHGERPADPAAARMLTDLDASIAKLRGW